MNYMFTVKKYLSNNIINKVYPLHDEEEIKRLGVDWYQVNKAFKEQPIRKLCVHFQVIYVNILLLRLCIHFQIIYMNILLLRLCFHVQIICIREYFVVTFVC